VRFADFETLARAQWEKVPAEYKQGVDALIIERDGRTHPNLEEIYTLGECITEAYPSDFGGPDTIRSAVALYYGSFLRLSHLDPQFDWEKEVWETITHELQHHLETLATEDDLEDFDYAVDENFKRLAGQPFDPLFFRAGEPISPATFRVEEDVFIELDPATASATVEFEWENSRYAIALPRVTADVTFVRVEGGPDVSPGEFWLVLVPRRGMLRVVGDALRRRPLEVAETEATAEVVM
jgi:predicted Zn-dependent protease with MMP-like domain